MTKIVFTGGGTAGHIFPILAIVRAIKKTTESSQIKLFYLGPKDAYALRLLQEEGVAVKRIITGKIRRYFSIKNIIDLFKIPIGMLQAFFWLFVLAPDLVFSKGGFGSFPSVFNAMLLRIPLFMHESDSSPGMVSKITSKWALEIFTSFPETEYLKKKKIICLGNPIRTQVLNGSAKKTKEIFNLQGGKPLIFVIGGSQGAKSVNNTLLEVMQEFLAEFELIHQTGRAHYKQVKAEVNVLVKKEDRKYYHPIPFLNEAELKHILAAADLIISRAGSSMIFEMAATARPAILIPLPKSAQNHQVKNAYQFSKKGAAEVLEEQNLKPHFLLEKVKYLIGRKDLLIRMSASAKSFARPKSALVIANYILEYLSQLR